MHDVLVKISEIGLVPVIAISDADKAVPLARALIAGGIPCAEITFRTAQGEESIRRVAAEVPEILLGAGTVTTTDQVDRAAAAGAKFIVSPGFNPKVVARCIEKGIPVTPGCSSPSDIEQALEFGLDTVKFFPAEQSGGLDFIKAVAAPYPTVKFIPTGGINASNAGKYLAFEKVIACGGSWMAPANLINGGNFAEITRLCKEARAAIGSESAGSVSESKAAEPPLTPADSQAASSRARSVGSGKSAARVVTFGEIMLRLAPEGYYRFTQAETFGASYGGGEANVAVSLANFGADASFVTKLPKNDIGQAAVNSLRRFGVDTSNIVRGGDRVGIYFLEKGASQRASKVIYDRAGSSIAKASQSDFDWKKIFEGAGWFHFTGITPALSDSAAAACADACKAAKAAGLTVSCDLNYRKNLWSREKAGQVMAGLMKYVDVCIANEEDAGDVFGIKAEETDVTGGKLSRDGYKSVAKQLAAVFGFSLVAVTLRESVSASDNNWAAMLYDCGSGEYFFSKKYAVHIVDRVGGGDSFAAGLIYGSLRAVPLQETLEFAAAASALKHTIEGDFNRVSVDEAMKLAGGDGSGRVQR